jgi:hypothetical protein
MMSGMPIRRISFCASRYEIEQLGDKLSPARAEALLDEFEYNIREAFLRRDLSAVMNNCEKYVRRFRALGEEKE